MIEAEIKLKIVSLEALCEKLTVCGFAAGEHLKESDIYFNSPSRDFRKTDEALRIRTSTDQATGESVSLINYKGPKLDQVTMTRVERETEIADGETAKQILEAIGFVLVSPVVKERQYFRKQVVFYGSLESENPEENSSAEPAQRRMAAPCCREMTVCLDRVEGLGDFMELEILVESDEEREEAVRQMENVLRELGYEMRDTVRRSYLSMLEGKLYFDP